MFKWFKEQSKAVKTLIIIVLAVVLLAPCCCCGGFFTLNYFRKRQPSQGLSKAYAKDPDPKKLIQTKTWGEVPANQVAVIFKDDYGRQDAERLANQLDAKIVGEIGVINLYQLEGKGSTEADLKAALKQAKGFEGVEGAFPNTRLYPEEEIKGTAFNPYREGVYETENSLPYDLIGLDRATRFLNGSGVRINDVHVGVADEAFYEKSGELDQVELDDRGYKGGKGKARVSGIDTGDLTDEPQKNAEGEVVDNGLSHGTEVIHVLAGDPQDGGVAGVAGVLQDDLHVVVTNIYDAEEEYKESVADPSDSTQMAWTDGKAYTVKTLVHMKKLIRSGATIINCSFGQDPSDSNELLAAAYRKFIEAHPDVLFVGSAGNKAGEINGKNRWSGQKLPNLITVGAIENDGARASFSNWAGEGGEVSIAAPGVKVVVGVDSDGNPIVHSGTSLAAPQVAGAATLLKAINPKLTPAEIKKILIETGANEVTGTKASVKIPDELGGKLLRVDKAVLKVINDLRAKRGLPPLSEEELLAMSEIELTAKGGPTDYEIVAYLKAVGEKGTKVRIELKGEGILAGRHTQQLSSPGSVFWRLSLARGKTVTVKVTRIDTKAWAYVSLTAYTYSGRYVDGEWVIEIDDENNITIQEKYESTVDPYQGTPLEGQYPNRTFIKSYSLSGTVSEDGEIKAEGTVSRRWTNPDSEGSPESVRFEGTVEGDTITGYIINRFGRKDAKIEAQRQ